MLRTFIKMAYTFLQLDDRYWQGAESPYYLPLAFIMSLLMCAAGWLYDVMGLWCLILVLILMVLTIMLARYLPDGAKSKSWSSRAVRGFEKWIYEKLEHDLIPGSLIMLVMIGVSFAGLYILVHGIGVQDFWMFVTGYVITFASKLWMLDRFALVESDIVSKQEESS